MPAPDPEEIAARARALAAQHSDDLERLRGRRIRVLRAVVYEGEAEAVFEQLARSLPTGTRDMKVAGNLAGRTMTVTVIQDPAVVLVSAADLHVD